MEPTVQQPKSQQKVGTALNWSVVLKSILDSPNYKLIVEKVAARRKTVRVYPTENQILRAFDSCPYPDTKVVLLGQDPYTKKDQADGLAFSTQSGITPPSLEVIFREINESLYEGIETSKDPDLTRWAKQGVLLLNTIFTVEEGKPGSHANLGWQLITERIIRLLNSHPNNLVFLLLGKQAQYYSRFIDDGYHCILTAPHPASECYNPGSGFIGSGIFAKANDYIRKNYGKNHEISW